MAIRTEQLKDMYLSSDVVTNISVVNEVQPNISAVVNSGAIYNALSDLSAALVGQLKPQTKVDSKTFDFSEIPTVKVDGVENDRRMIVNNNGVFELSTISGYDSGSQYFRIPSIVSLNNGRKVVIFDVRWNSTEDIGRTNYYNLTIGETHSDDYGASWSSPHNVIDWLYPDYDPSIPTTDYQSGVSDPGIIYDEEHNVIMVFALGGYGFQQRIPEILSGDLPYSDLSSYKYQQLVFSYSKDNGETWSKPATVTNRIFDPNGTTQEWARTYRYCFSTCTTGITLHRQSNTEYNGTLVFPVQLIKNGWGSSNWFSELRISLLKIEPTYDENNDIIDIKLTFLTDGTNQILLGGECGGANECAICEGPNGEIAIAARTYNFVENPNGIYQNLSNNSTIMIRIFKSNGLYQPWSMVGNQQVGSSQEYICTTLETTGKPKPALVWSEQLQLYVIGYIQALYNSSTDSDIRSNLVLRCSKDLLTWNYVNSLELNTGSGYITAVPQYDKNKCVEFIYEAHNDGIGGEMAKQLKYAAFKATGGNEYGFSSFVLDQGAIDTTKDVQGFSLNIHQANVLGPIFPYSSIVHAISKMSIYWGGFSSSQSSIYAVVYGSNSSTATPITYSDPLNLSTASNFPDNIVEFDFHYPIVIDPKIDNEYFIYFKSGSVPSDIMNTQRGNIPTNGGNVASVKAFASRYNTENYMKVYRNGNVITAGSPTAYPVSLLITLS